MFTGTHYPWEGDIWSEILLLGIIITMHLVIWYAIKSGRDRKEIPEELGRKIEDFAGHIQEGNNPMTAFLAATYITIIVWIGFYVVYMSIRGMNY